MAYIKFNDKEQPIVAFVKIISNNLIRITTEDEPNISGFSLFLDGRMKMPMSNEQYENFTTLYRQGEGWYELSNDGSVYEEPIPLVRFVVYFERATLDGDIEQSVRNYEDLVIPTVNPSENYEFVEWNPNIPETGVIANDTTFTAMLKYVPTLEEVKVSKIEEMEVAKDIVFEQGFNVQLSSGEIEHFDLSGDNKLYLTALQTQVIAGVDPIPWHVSDKSIACKTYSNTDMGIITQTALSLVMYHETYIRDIIRYIQSFESKDDLEAIEYGMVLPVEFQSEPLQGMLAQVNE